MGGGYTAGWTCPIHSSVGLIPMFDDNPYSNYPIAWRCDRCRALYHLNDDGYWEEAPWPEVDRRAYYRGEPPPEKKTVVVPGQPARVVKRLILPAGTAEKT